MGKLLPLESLRGIAALSVVIHHFPIGSHFNISFTNNAKFMVDFFFVLSGFVMCLSYKDRISSITSLIEFQKRRFWRIYPLHLLILIVFLGIEYAKYYAEIGLGFELDNPAFTYNNITSFFANLFLLQNWILPYLSFNHPSWSISAEFFTYLIFATTLLIVKNEKVLAAIAIIFIAISANFLMVHGWGIYIGGPARCVYGFFLGVIAYLVFDRLRFMRLDHSLPATLLLIACVWCISIQYFVFKFEICLPLLFAVTIIAVAKTSDATVISKILSDARLVWLGTISYGVYMIHSEVIVCLEQILRFVFNFPIKMLEEETEIFNISSVWLADLIVILAIAITIGLASLSYYRLEKPIYASSKKSLRRQEKSIIRSGRFFQG